jgi:hypothetical protein
MFLNFSIFSSAEVETINSDRERLANMLQEFKPWEPLMFFFVFH